jgi:hypothetical protein
VPDFKCPHGGDRIWNSRCTLSGAAGRHEVTFQSSTYSDFRQLLAQETTTKSVTVKAYLGFPEQVRDRYPAVIIVHTIAGYRDANEGYAAAELRKAGFATLTYDSFAARGTTGAALSGSSGYLPIGVADAYAAMRLLSGEPALTPTVLPSSASRTEVKWRISLHSRRCEQRSIPDRAALPRTSHSIPAGILARSPNPVPIPALRC